MICRLCLEDKEESYFNKCSRKKNGLQTYCRECQKSVSKNWENSNTDHRKIYRKEYKASNKERAKELKRTWDLENKEHRRQYRIDRRGYYSFRASIRYHRQKKAQPIWLSEEQLTVIQQYYWLAEDLQLISGGKYHVDHIVPIQGSNVCGLHVPWNLQILPSDINISKSNKFEDEGL